MEKERRTDHQQFKEGEVSATNNIHEFTTTLLAKEPQRLPGLKRLQFDIPQSDTVSFYHEIVSLGLSDMVKKRVMTIPGKEDESGYPLFEKKNLLEEKPDYAFLFFQERDHRAFIPDEDALWQEVEVGFRFGKHDYYHNDVRLHLELQAPFEKLTVSSFVFSPDLSDQGYEGHDDKNHSLTEKELGSLYSLIKIYSSKEKQQQVLDEMLSEVILVDRESGEEFLYNTENHEWNIPDTYTDRLGGDKRSILHLKTIFQFKRIPTKQKGQQ